MCDVLRRLGEGYRHLHQFRGKEAIAAFDQLSPSEGNNAWVQVQTATAYFNMAQYSMAEQAFKKARKLEVCCTLPPCPAAMPCRHGCSCART